MATARSTPNIALIKYWGNRNDALRLPAADSLSMTLDGPHVDITIEYADAFSVTSTNKTLNEKDIARFRATVDRIGEFVGITQPLSITIDSKIPPAIGLASSAAVFSALAKAIAGLLDTGLSDEQISVMARLGSGSAARSIFGGFSALKNKNSDAIDGSVAMPIAPQSHWSLHDIVVIPSLTEKKTGSTEGHASAHTSPHFRDRIAAIPRRMEECIDAVLKKDFEKLRHVAEEDCLDMHACMETQNPPLRYLSDETERIIREIEELRTKEHLPVLYTMDAGPTVHLICTEEARNGVLAYAKAQTACTIFEAKTGPAARLL